MKVSDTPSFRDLLLLRSEWEVVHRFIHQYTVLRLEVEADVLLRLQVDGEEDDIAFHRLAVADVDKGGIERLHAVGVQTIVRQVAHPGYSVCLYARELINCGVVGQGKAEGIDSIEALAAHYDVDVLTGLIGLLGSAECDASLEGIGLLKHDASVHMGGYG